MCERVHFYVKSEHFFGPPGGSYGPLQSFDQGPLELKTRFSSKLIHPMAKKSVYVNQKSKHQYSTRCYENGMVCNSYCVARGQDISKVQISNARNIKCEGFVALWGVFVILIMLVLVGL